MHHVTKYFVLPKTVTPFEARYLGRMNRLALVFFWLHVPVFALVAMFSDTSVPLAIELTLGALAGPTIAYFGLPTRPRLVSVIFGVTSALLGGVLVYIGQGPMQIEMHFYFFVLIALLAVFGNPTAIIAAAGSVAAHHGVMWMVLPQGVFNHSATVGTVVVHAIFVVVESVAACFVARSFFDNVIGLEAIVTERTRALDTRKRDMALILDHVGQGFASVDFKGCIGPEWSRSLESWFGTPTPGAPIWDYLFDDEDQRTWMQFGFESFVDGFMPFEVICEQLPRRRTKGTRELRLDYQGMGSPPTGILIVVSDITDEVERLRAESGQRELLAVVERAVRDRAGFLTFMADTDDLIRTTVRAQDDELKRHLHTLKGNTALFGVDSIASVCHQLETQLADSDEPLDHASRLRLVSTWDSFRGRANRVLGITNKRSVVVDWDDYDAAVSAITLQPEPPWLHQIRDWGKVSTRARLEQCADYARMLAERIGKPGLVVEILDHHVRLAADDYARLWPAFVHAIRNMVDHGVEAPELRRVAGKSEHGVITFESRIIDGEFHLEIADDGPGIDWDRVAAHARALSIPAATQDEIEQALFASGVSTALEVTDLSGRGVGMDALRTTCRELGGRVEVTSTRGTGTRIACILPLVLARRAPRSRPAKISGEHHVR